MGFFSNTEREDHNDGSYTIRNEEKGSSTTYDKNGNLKEYSFTDVPIIGQTNVKTYDRDGNLTNFQYVDRDYGSSSGSSDGGSGK